MARYTAWVWHLLGPLGVWGVFVVAFADSALLGMPIDAVVAVYVYNDRTHFYLYMLLASLGSALGSIPLYVIGYLGGEKVLRKRISEDRFLRIHGSFERHEFWALMFPAMLPPPTPLKIFVLGAAVFEMRFEHFLAAIFVGRIVRFGVLAALTLRFGPQIIGATKTMVRQYFYWLVIGVLGALLAWWLVQRRRGYHFKNGAVWPRE